MILVDTSIWIDHLRSTDSHLVSMLESGLVVTHPFIVGELACGNIKNRTEVLNLFRDLVTLDCATHDEALAFISTRQLMGRGIGYVDVHLLAALFLDPPTRIWTRDKRLNAVADELGVSYSETPVHAQR